MANSKNIETKVTLSPIAVMAISFGGYFFYELESNEATLKADIEGLDEYELCQYAYEKHGMNMIKDMGCTDNRHSFSRHAD